MRIDYVRKTKNGDLYIGEERMGRIDNKITAIKAYRKITGYGLRESKDAIDSVAPYEYLETLQNAARWKGLPLFVESGRTVPAVTFHDGNGHIVFTLTGFAKVDRTVLAVSDKILETLDNDFDGNAEMRIGELNIAG